LQLADPGNGADAVESFGRHLLDVLALSQGKYQLVRGGEGGLDGLESHGTAGAGRGGHTRKEHHVAKWQYRQGQSFSHWLLLRIGGDGAAAVLPQLGGQGALVVPPHKG